MSKIKNGGLDQYGAGPFEQQQFGTAGIEGVNTGADNNLSTKLTTRWPVYAVSYVTDYTHCASRIRYSNCRVYQQPDRPAD